MPKSANEGKEEIVQWCKELTDIHRIVDVGAGSGTYIRMFKKRNLFKSSEWIGIEAWAPYIEEYNLTNRYNQIINKDLRLVDFSTIGNVDLVFLGDVLEHITKEEAVNFLDSISTYSRYAIISIPIVYYPQGEHEGNPYEVHVKDDWSHEEVLTSFKGIEKHFIGEVIGCYLLKLK